MIPFFYWQCQLLLNVNNRGYTAIALPLKLEVNEGLNIAALDLYDEINQDYQYDCLTDKW